MNLRPLGWIGSTKRDLSGFPADAIREIGHALYRAQLGDRHPAAKPLKGFGGANVLEVVEDHDGDTYRAVYTVRFAEVVYVLHVFKKNAKSGIATPQHDIELIKARLKRAEQEYASWKRQKP